VYSDNWNSKPVKVLFKVKWAYSCDMIASFIVEPLMCQKTLASLAEHRQIRASINVIVHRGVASEAIKDFFAETYEEDDENPGHDILYVHGHVFMQTRKLLSKRKHGGGAADGGDGGRDRGVRGAAKRLRLQDFDDPTARASESNDLCWVK
jgi:hypothetical protein